VQANLYEFQRRQIVLITRVTPYVMVGHVVNTAVIAVALAGSVQTIPLVVWCAYSCSIALLLLFRHVKNRGRSPRSFQRAARKMTIYAFFLAVPWSSLAILYLGSVSQADELILVALGIGMAACATVVLAAIPPAAFIYMSVILIPSALKCLLVSQEGYLLLGTLALSYWGCLAALIVKTSRDIRERQESELALAERNAQLALAGRAALVGSYTYDVKKASMQVSEGYAAIHGLPEGTIETSYGKWRTRVHPEDLEWAEGVRDQAFTDRRKEDNAEYRIILSTGEVRWIERRGFISYGADGRPARVVGVNIDITERKQSERHQRTLNAELDHRVKNVLATVGAIIGQTQEANRSPADFVAALNLRIKSLAGTHELLSRAHWHGVPLAEIIRRELAPYGTTNTELGGPGVTLKAEATQAVATVLHELTTNAAKYGAFSNRTGRVSVQWKWLNNGSHQRLIIQWQEAGGPPVLAPSQTGYGTSIIRDLIPFELGGKVELVFAFSGIRCRLEIPGDWINSDRQLAGEPKWHPADDQRRSANVVSFLRGS
jgi:PAS domain S-box-containing protein